MHAKILAKASEVKYHLWHILSDMNTISKYILYKYDFCKHVNKFKNVIRDGVNNSENWFKYRPDYRLY